MSINTDGTEQKHGTLSYLSMLQPQEGASQCDCNGTINILSIIEIDNLQGR